MFPCFLFEYKSTLWLNLCDKIMTVKRNTLNLLIRPKNNSWINFKIIIFPLNKFYCIVNGISSLEYKVISLSKYFTHEATENFNLS